MTKLQICLSLLVSGVYCFGHGPWHKHPPPVALASPGCNEHSVPYAGPDITSLPRQSSSSTSPLTTVYSLSSSTASLLLDNGGRTGRLQLTAPPRAVTPSSYATGACPPFTPPNATLTVHSTSTEYIATSTRTLDGPTTVYVTGSVPTTYTQYSSSKPWTFTTDTALPTYTVTALVIAGATTTTVVPRPAGFVPVKCQPEYYRGTTTLTVQDTISLTSVSTFFVPTGSTVTSVVPNVTSITATGEAPAQTVVVPPTTTVTTTRTIATSTIYEACSTDNVVRDRAYGGFFNFVVPVELRGYVPVVSFNEVLAADPVDCCAQCQADSTCVGSAFQGSSYFCKLYHKTEAVANQTCEPDFSGILVGEPTSFNNNYYLSNGACGQLAYSVPLS